MACGRPRTAFSSRTCRCPDFRECSHELSGRLRCVPALSSCRELDVAVPLLTCRDEMTAQGVPRRFSRHSQPSTCPWSLRGGSCPEVCFSPGMLCAWDMAWRSSLNVCLCFVLFLCAVWEAAPTAFPAPLPLLPLPLRAPRAWRDPCWD